MTARRLADLAANMVVPGAATRRVSTSRPTAFHAFACHRLVSDPGPIVAGSVLTRFHAFRRHGIALLALLVSIAAHLAALLAPWEPPVPVAAPSQPPVTVTLLPPPAAVPRASDPAPSAPAASPAAATRAPARPRPLVTPRVVQPRLAAGQPAGDAPMAASDVPAVPTGSDTAVSPDGPQAPAVAGAVPPSDAGDGTDAPPQVQADTPVASAPPLPPAAVARLPERIELAFDAYLESLGGDTRIGTARFELRLEGGRYHMAIDARGPLATLAFQSEGAFEPAGFRPDRFTEHRRVAFRRPLDRSVRYLHAGAPVEAAAVGAEAAVPEPAGAGAVLAVPAGTQDRLSALFQLWLIARAAAAFPEPGHEIPMPLATLSKVHAARFKVSAPEPFVVGDRGVGAVRFTMLRDGPEPVIDVWLADDAQRLPVQLRYAEKNQAVRFVATGAR